MVMLFSCSRCVGLIVLVLMCSVLALSVKADVIEVPLREMIKESELIFIGKVIAHVKTGEKDILEKEGFKREYPFYKVTIEVESIFKGDLKKDKIEAYHFKTSGDPVFRVHERSVFFIAADPRQAFKGRKSVVRGYAGMVPIKGDTVRPLYIQGEQGEQKLADFIQKIRKVVEAGG